MTLTVRLKQEERRILDRAEKRYGKIRSRSALVREAVVNYWKTKLEEEELSPYDLVKDAIGCYKDGPADLSERVHEHYRKSLHARRTRSR